VAGKRIAAILTSGCKPTIGVNTAFPDLLAILRTDPDGQMASVNACRLLRVFTSTVLRVFVRLDFCFDVPISSATSGEPPCKP
jgi:hypothetical protein